MDRVAGEEQAAEAHRLGDGEMIAEGAAWELRGNELIRRVYLGEAIAG